MTEKRLRATESAPADRRRALLLGALATVVYLLTAPGVVNADGLGYLKLLPYNFAAGHLLYMPLLRLATRLVGGNGLEAGRLANALLGGSGVVLFFGIVRRVAGDAGLLAADARFAGTAAAAGLALSYGYWVQASDVEAYAAAMVALLATVRLAVAYQRRPTALRALTVGAALGVAVLFHLTHVCASVLVWVALSRFGRRTHALLALATGGALALGGYAYAALVVRGHDLTAAVHWVSTAAHGFHQDAGVYRLADAIYGLAKSVVWSPYLYEADAQKLLGQFLLGFAPLVALGVWSWTRARARTLPQLDATLAIAWAAPYAVIGLVFLGSDSERWLFVLPVGWLLAGTLLATSTRRAQRCALVLVYLGALNFATALEPAHRDSSMRHRAEAVGALLSDHDTVIFPGHSWDEYVAFYSRARVWPVPLVYYAARDGNDEAWRRLDREVAAALMRGGKVYAVRIFSGSGGSDDDGDSRGWSELEQLGLSKEVVRAHLLQSLRPVPLDGIAPGIPLVRLDPIL